VNKFYANPLTSARIFAISITDVVLTLRIWLKLVCGAFKHGAHANHIACLEGQERTDRKFSSETSWKCQPHHPSVNNGNMTSPDDSRFHSKKGRLKNEIRGSEPEKYLGPRKRREREEEEADKHSQIVQGLERRTKPNSKGFDENKFF